MWSLCSVDFHTLTLQLPIQTLHSVAPELQVRTRIRIRIRTQIPVYADTMGKGSKSGADPGFPVGGGADPTWGVATYDFVKFSQKLHEIEKIWAVGGGTLGSATANLNVSQWKHVLHNTM